MKGNFSPQHYASYQCHNNYRENTDALKENLLEIAPYVTIETHSVRISENSAEALLEKADIICEAFDDAESKAMLVNIVTERMPEKYLVAASGMAGMGSANTIQTRRISKRFYLCGDGASDVSEAGSLVASRVMLCAAHQAHTVLRILTKQFET